MVLLDWEDHFGNVSQRVLPWVISDHCPFLLEADGFHKGRCAFKFENMWLKAEGFVERVQQWWNGYCFVGSPSYILAKKLKVLKVDLKKWNREEFGDLAFRKISLLSELLGIDAIEEVRCLSNEEQSHHIQMRGDIEYLASLEEIFLETNPVSCSFHRLANSHRRVNQMRWVCVLK